MRLNSGDQTVHFILLHRLQPLSYMYCQFQFLHYLTTWWHFFQVLVHLLYWLGCIHPAPTVLKFGIPGIELLWSSSVFVLWYCVAPFLDSSISHFSVVLYVGYLHELNIWRWQKQIKCISTHFIKHLPFRAQLHYRIDGRWIIFPSIFRYGKTCNNTRSRS